MVAKKSAQVRRPSPASKKIDRELDLGVMVVEGLKSIEALRTALSKARATLASLRDCAQLSPTPSWQETIKNRISQIDSVLEDTLNKETR